MIEESTYNKNNFFQPYHYDPNYLLDNYLYNKKNKLSYITCYNLLQNNFQECKIFIIYGEPGTGKTHLLKAILNHFAYDKNNNILYTNPSTIYRLINKKKYLHKNQNQIQNFNIISIDDFHHIKYYSQVIDEIYNFLYYCLTNNKKAFIACDKKADIYRNFGDTFRSVLESGLHIHLNYPDMDVKIRYIDLFCAQNDLPLTDEQRIHLSRQFNGFKNIRTVLIRLLRTIDPKTSIQCPDSLLDQKIQSVATPPLSIASVISEVSDYFQLLPEDILSGSKRREAVLARQIGMTICRQLLHVSYPRIGEAFGGRNHGTVMHSVNKILKSLENNNNLQLMFQAVKHRCEHLRI